LAARQQFVGMLTMSPYLNRPFFFMDEQGFHLQTRRTKGRAPQGQPAKLSVVPKGKRVNLIACLGQNGFVHHRIVNPTGDKKNGVDAEEFRAFLADLVPKLPRGAVLVLDNAKIHHAEKLDSMWVMIKQTYGIDHCFLPPYSPFMNPIEYAFCKLKGLVQQSEFYRRGDLVEVIQGHIPSITTEDTQQFFKKSFSYFPQAALGLPFQGKALDPQLAQAFPAAPDGTTAVITPPQLQQ
jgi:transposase